MKILLTANIKNIGRKGDVRSVRHGYARNYLIPQGLARLANQDALDEIEEQLRAQEQEASKELSSIQNLAEKIDGITISINAKADENNTLYKGVSEKEIVKILSKNGYDIKKENVKIDKPLKEIGEFPVGLELGHGIEVTFNLVIEPEIKEV